MKTLVAICVVACVAVVQGVGLTQEQINTLKENMQTCTASSGANDTLINKVCKGEPVEDAKVYDFFDCMFKRLNFINNDGVIQLDIIRTKIPVDISPEDVVRVLLACEKVKGEPIEKKAYAAYLCFKQQTKGKLELIPQVA